MKSPFLAERTRQPAALGIYATSTPPRKDLKGADLHRQERLKGTIGGLKAHYVIRRDGTVDAVRPTWASCAPFPEDEIIVLVVGGIEGPKLKNGRISWRAYTGAQEDALASLHSDLPRRDHRP